MARSLRSELLPGAEELNRRLARERLGAGRGLDRAGDRLPWKANTDDLPSGTVIIDEDRQARLVTETRMLVFDFDGWHDPKPRPGGKVVEVLTPPTSVAALTHGYVPVLHPSSTPEAG